MRKYIAAGQNDIAKIHAETAIRQKTEATNYLRLSSRLEAVASKLRSTKNIQQMSKQLEGVSKSMGVTMKNMNLSKTALTMEKFTVDFFFGGFLLKKTSYIFFTGAV